MSAPYVQGVTIEGAQVGVSAILRLVWLPSSDAETISAAPNTVPPEMRAALRAWLDSADVASGAPA